MSTMPTLPHPPTDNIYKFCALTGTVAVILAIYVQVTRSLDLDDKLNALYAKLNTCKAEEDICHQRISELNTIADEDVAQKNGTFVVDKSISYVPLTAEEIKQKMNDRDESIYKLTLKMAEANSMSNEIQTMIAVEDRISRGAIAVYIIGGLLIIIGFALWYFKVQRYEDAKLRSEAADAKEALEHNRKRRKQEEGQTAAQKVLIAP